MGSALQTFNMKYFMLLAFCLSILFHQARGVYDPNCCCEPDCCGKCFGIECFCGFSSLTAAASTVAAAAYSASASCYSGTSYNQRTGKCQKGGGCFPGTAEVTLASGGREKMKELKVGDEVLTSSGTFSAVLGWLDIQPGQETNFIKLETNLSSSTSMTGSHVIFSRSVNEESATPKYADEVKMGDLIIGEEAGELAEVVNISRFSSVGYYAPLTYEGTVVVDGYLASCYASYPHWVAHAALYPARAWPGIFLGEKEGTGTFVTAVKTLGDMLKIRNVAIPALAMMDAVKQEL